MRRGRQVEGATWTMTLVSMGNPHNLIFSKDGAEFKARVTQSMQLWRWELFCLEHVRVVVCRCSLEREHIASSCNHDTMCALLAELTSRGYVGDQLIPGCRVRIPCLLLRD